MTRPAPTKEEGCVNKFAVVIMPRQGADMISYNGDVEQAVKGGGRLVYKGEFKNNGPDRRRIELDPIMLVAGTDSDIAIVVVPYWQGED